MNSIENLLDDPVSKKLHLVDNAEHEHWKKSWSSSFCKDNFFTDNELEWLTDLMYKQHYSRRVKKNGTLHFRVDNRHIQDKFFEKLKEIIPELDNSPLWEGNFLITSTPYNLHIDTGNPEHIAKTNFVPGKQIIIPLWVCHTNKDDSDPECGTAIFKNRFIMYGTNFAKSDANYDTNVFYTIRDYNDLICYGHDGNKLSIDWNKSFDKNLYDRYFGHFPKKWLDGFELDNVYNWKRGSIIVFDRSQAHSGINFQKNNVTLKCGLSLMTTVEYDRKK